MHKSVQLPEKLQDVRVLFYSHDTFGLGHLRRTRTIAHSMVEQFKGLTGLILSGSPIIGRFDFKARVDFVRIPGVIKLRNGDYTSLGLHINIEHTLELRESIILHTAKVFSPDIFIVDKEPLGLRGEVEETLKMLRSRKIPTVLGLRDALDSPELLREEWRKKNAVAALDYYDEIWIYGDPSMGDPFKGLALPGSVREKIVYTGYLYRGLPEGTESRYLREVPKPYLLITAGGGGDGVQMIDWVLRAYEARRDLPWHGLFVLGPFMSQEDTEQFRDRIDKLEHASLITFDNNMESLMTHAEGVVAMGGYNTFCEILSLNKRALIVPRTEPREEQLLRACRAAENGLVSLLDPRQSQDVQLMLKALGELPEQKLPADIMPADFLSGLETVNIRLTELVDPPQREQTAKAVTQD